MILQLDFTVSLDSDIFYPGLLPVIDSPEVDSEFLIMMHCSIVLLLVLLLVLHNQGLVRQVCILRTVSRSGLKFEFKFCSTQEWPEFIFAIMGSVSTAV